jgi:hypothetical protein
MSHRRCDRVLPRCGECTKKGKVCNWDPPSKRGRKGKEKPSTTQTESALPTKNVEIKQQPNFITNEEVLLALTQRHTQIQRVFDIMPLFPKNVLDNLLLHVRAMHGELSVTNTFSNTEIAYMMAMLAYILLCNGHSMVGRHLHDKALQLLGGAHGEVYDYTIACCVQYLATFNLSENEIDFARQRVLQVWNYIQRAAQVIPLNDISQNSLELARHRFLRHRCLIMAALLANRVDEALSIKFLLREWYLDLKFIQAQGRTIPYFGDNYEQFMLRIDSDIVNATNHEALGLNTLNQFAEYFRQYTHEDLYKTLVMCINAYKIHLLHGMGRSLDNEIKTAADIVASNAAAPLNLSSPPLWAQSIARACTVHLQYFDMTKTPTERADAISRLAEEKKALCTLAQNHKIIGERFYTTVKRVLDTVAPFEQVSSINTLSQQQQQQQQPTLPYNFNRTMANFKNTIMGDKSEDEQVPQQIVQQQHHYPVQTSVPPQIVTMHQPVPQYYTVVPAYTTTFQYVQVPVHVPVEQYAMSQQRNCSMGSTQFLSNSGDDLENFIEDFFGEHSKKSDSYDDFDFL